MAKKKAKRPPSKAVKRNRLVCNDASKVVKQQLQTIHANISKGLIRNDTMEGRDFTVVPMVMIVEGVLNGSQGALLYPGEELEKTPIIWNSKPVVVYHPEVNGVNVSACDPDIITKYKIGVIMNAHTIVEGGLTKLKAEAWLETNRIELVDSRVSIAINNEEVLELSTGLFTDTEITSGEFNGVPYDGIARNFRPDHLAVLPDQIGACSIDDGAGFIRMNKKGDGLEIIKDNVDITNDFVSVNQSKADKFKTNSFKIITVSKELGIKALVGELKDNRIKTDEPTTQSFLFNKETWNASKAKKWVKEHKGVLSNVESRNDFVLNELKVETELPENVQIALNRKMVKEAMPYFTINQISHDQLRGLLWAALEEKFKASANPNGFIDIWIMEVFDNFVIYEFDNKLWKLNYMHSDIAVTFEGDPIEVFRVTQFETVDGVVIGNKTTNNEIKNMKTKKELVDNLVENHGWEESDREFLMGKSEERLIEINAKHDPAEDAAASTGSLDTNAGVQSVAAPATVVTASQYIDDAPKELQDVMRSSLALHENQKALLVAGILANEKNTFSEEVLNSKDLEELQSISSIAGVEKPAVNYSAQAGTSSSAPHSQSKETPLANSGLDFEKKSK